MTSKKNHIFVKAEHVKRPSLFPTTIFDKTSTHSNISYNIICLPTFPTTQGVDIGKIKTTKKRKT